MTRIKQCQLILQICQWFYEFTNEKLVVLCDSVDVYLLVEKRIGKWAFLATKNDVVSNCILKCTKSTVEFIPSAKLQMNQVVIRCTIDAMSRGIQNTAVSAQILDFLEKFSGRSLIFVVFHVETDLS